MVRLCVDKGRKEGRKEIFIWQSIHKLVVFTIGIYNNFSLGDHTKTAVRSLSWTDGHHNTKTQTRHNYIN